MSSKGFFASIIGGILLFLTVVVLIFSIVRIPQGTVGVIYSMNGVKEHTLATGWHLTKPTDKVVKYPTRTQTITYKDLSASTRDGKNLVIDIDVNYKVDAKKAVDLFNRFGSADIKDLQEGYLRTRVQDNVRQSMSKYSVIDAFGVKTGEIKKDTLNKLIENLEPQGFVIEDIAISSPKADKETQKAIDERVKANQELERKRIDKEIAKEEAERREIEAEGIKKANNIMNESLSSELLTKELIEKWDGKSPIVFPSGEGIIIDMKNQGDR